MSGPSAYVHSNADNAGDLTVSLNLIDNIQGTNQFKDLGYIQSTLNKFDTIIKQLDSAAEQFLGGASLEGAQAAADNAGNTLIHLANTVLYGPKAYDMVQSLTLNQTLDKNQILQEGNFKYKFGKKVADYLEQSLGDVGVDELANFILKEVAGDKTEITVSEAGATIVRLGKIFDVKYIETSLRKGGTAEVNKAIFNKTKTLVTKSSGVFKGMIVDLIKSSKYLKTNDNLQTVVTRFCDKLQREMIEESKNQIQFLWTSDRNILVETIQEFTDKLQRELINNLNINKLSNTSNVIGEIGESIQESASVVAEGYGRTVVTFQIGDLTEDQATSKINQILKNKGNPNQLSKMLSYHEDGKQSQTDLVLLNNRTGQIARAQSKNHFVAYFTKPSDTNKAIENFRWKVEEGANLLKFMTKLSSPELGVGLNNFDITNLTEAIVNNLWFDAHESYWSKGWNGIDSKTVTVNDFKKDLEGALEKLLAGQVVNLLGVSIAPATNIKIDANASNIFYVLNGRMVKTSDLVREAKLQIEQSNFKREGIEADRSRMINVSVTTPNTGYISPGIFLINKLRMGATPEANNPQIQAYGENMGQHILNTMQIKVSLGTSLQDLKSTAFNW